MQHPTTTGTFRDKEEPYYNPDKQKCCKNCQHLESLNRDLSEKLNAVQEQLVQAETRIQEQQNKFKSDSYEIVEDQGILRTNLSVLWKYLQNSTLENLNLVEKYAQKYVPDNIIKTIILKLIKEIYRLTSENSNITSSVKNSKTTENVQYELSVGSKNSFKFEQRSISAGEQTVLFRKLAISEASEATENEQNFSNFKEGTLKKTDNADKNMVTSPKESQNTINIQSRKPQDSLQTTANNFQQAPETISTIQKQLQEKNNEISVMKDILEKTRQEWKKATFEEKLLNINEAVTENYQKWIIQDEKYKIQINQLTIANEQFATENSNLKSRNTELLNSIIEKKEQIIKKEKELERAYNKLKNRQKLKIIALKFVQVNTVNSLSKLNDLEKTIVSHTNALSLEQISKNAARNCIQRKTNNINRIRNLVRNYEDEIVNFDKRNNEQRYLDLTEILIRASEDLDKVSSNGNTEIQTERKSTIAYVNKLYHKLVNYSNKYQH